MHVADVTLGVYKQNLNAGLLQQHHFWAGLMAIFRVAVLLFIKPKLECLSVCLSAPCILSLSGLFPSLSHPETRCLSFACISFKWESKYHTRDGSCDLGPYARGLFSSSWLLWARWSRPSHSQVIPTYLLVMAVEIGHQRCSASVQDDVQFPCRTAADTQSIARPGVWGSWSSKATLMIGGLN